MTKQIDKDKYKDKDNDKDKDKDILRTPPKSNPRDLWPLRHLFRVMRRQDMTKKITKSKTNTKTMTYTFREHPQRALETCDLRLDTWDTDFISDNWEQQYQHLHCDPWIKSDGDSIRNSCDVSSMALFDQEDTRLNHVPKLPDPQSGACWILFIKMNKSWCCSL